MFEDSKMRQRDLFAVTRATSLSVKQVLIAFSLALLLWLLLASNVAVADRIVIDGKQHEDVVITIGESLYYVSFPKLGTTALVSKSEVSDEDVQIESFGEKRNALFAEWKLTNARLKEQREEEKRTRELEALETERLRILAEQEKKEADEVAAREHVRLEKERLGVNAAQVLAGDPKKFAENLRQAEEVERVAIAAELDELESELKRILLQSSDPSKVVVPDRIKNRVEELAELGREMAKRHSRAGNETGYSLESRKAAAITVLMEEGASRSEAVATVEDMARNFMLPAPPVNESEDDGTNQNVYSASIQRTAAIETLVENGWERSDAEIGVENMTQEVTVVNGKGEPVASKSVETETSPAARPKPSFTSERGLVDKGIEREVEENWTPRPGGNTKEDAAWVTRDIRNAKSWEELEEVIRFHDESGR